MPRVCFGQTLRALPAQIVWHLPLQNLWIWMLFRRVTSSHCHKFTKIFNSFIPHSCPAFLKCALSASCFPKDWVYASVQYWKIINTKFSFISVFRPQYYQSLILLDCGHVVYFPGYIIKWNKSCQNIFKNKVL